jgi:hypothetical protein
MPLRGEETDRFFERQIDITEPGRNRLDEMDGTVKFSLLQAGRPASHRDRLWPGKHILNRSDKIGMPVVREAKAGIDSL